VTDTAVPPARPGTPSSLPTAVDQEEALIGAMLGSPTAISQAARIVEDSDFWVRENAAVFRAICGLHAAGQAADPLTVSARCRAEGTEVDSQWLTRLEFSAVPANARTYARNVREAADHRRIIRVGQTITELGHRTDTDAAHLLGEAKDRLRDLVVGISDDPGLMSLSQLVALAEIDYDWVIPQLVARSERIMVVAGESGGKSVLMRQMAVMSAVGLHPIFLEPMQPVRTLLLDFENPQHIVARVMRKLQVSAQQWARDAYDDSRFAWWSDEAGIDVSRPVDRDRVFRAVEAHQPDIVFIGPTYKMHDGDPEREATHMDIRRFLDELRTTFSCALMIEAHAPMTEKDGKRVLRPIHSSLWGRWCDHGMAIQPTDESGEVCNIRWWKNRDPRPWPLAIQRGATWPWEVHTHHPTRGRSSAPPAAAGAYVAPEPGEYDDDTF
jgi:replicative DNA helicase